MIKQLHAHENVVVIIWNDLLHLPALIQCVSQCLTTFDTVLPLPEISWCSSACDSEASGSSSFLASAEDESDSNSSIDFSHFLLAFWLESVIALFVLPSTLLLLWGYSYGDILFCDSAFAHKKEFSIIKFPERVSEISCRDLISGCEWWLEQLVGLPWKMTNNQLKWVTGMCHHHNCWVVLYGRQQEILRMNSCSRSWVESGMKQKTFTFCCCIVGTNKEASKRQRSEIPETTDCIFFGTISIQIWNPGFQHAKDIQCNSKDSFCTIPLNSETHDSPAHSQ